MLRTALKPLQIQLLNAQHTQSPLELLLFGLFGVEDALAVVDEHLDIQLKVDVGLHDSFAGHAVAATVVQAISPVFCPVGQTI